MAAEPTEFALTLTPKSRYDAIDVAAAIRREFGDVLAGFPRATYCSLHTTAGYLDQSLSARLDHRRDRLDPFIRAFQALFPPDAGYRHDRLHERSELSETQRRRSIPPRQRSLRPSTPNRQPTRRLLEPAAPEAAC